MACVPLVGLEVLGAALGESYPARLEHALVLVRHPPPPGAAKGKGTTTAYDFLPLDPLSPFTALPSHPMAGDAVTGIYARLTKAAITCEQHQDLNSPICVGCAPHT